MATALTRIWGACEPDREAALRQNGGVRETPMSHRVATSLSLHHDSRFSAFSTEALVRLNRDAYAVVLPALP